MRAAEEAPSDTHLRTCFYYGLVAPIALALRLAFLPTRPLHAVDALAALPHGCNTATRLHHCPCCPAVYPQVILVGDLNIAAERRDAHSTYNFDNMYDKEVRTDVQELRQVPCWCAGLFVF